MKITDIIRGILDLADTSLNIQTQSDSLPSDIEIDTNLVDVDQTDSSEIDEIAKLAGVSRASTTPSEIVFPLSSAYPAGDDVHQSKNPADIRSDSFSMYPGYQAEKK